MKPEASGSQKSEVEPMRSGASEGEAEQSQKEEEVEMTEDEKVLMNILIDNTPIALNELKANAG